MCQVKFEIFNQYSLSLWSWGTGFYNHHKLKIKIGEKEGPGDDMRWTQIAQIRDQLLGQAISTIQRKTNYEGKRENESY